jgi:outer membrane protein assembly factor BamB
VKKKTPQPSSEVNPEVAEKVALLIKTDKKQLKKNLLHDLVRTGKSAVMPLVRALNEAKTPQDRCLIVEALGNIRDARAFEAVDDAMQSGDTATRAEGARALAKIGGDRSIPALNLLLRDPDREIQLAAVDALGFVPSEKSIALLISLFEHDHGPLRLRAGSSLKAIGKPAVEPLMNAAAKGNLHVILCLTEVGDERALPQIIGLLRHRDKNCHYWASLGLKRITGEDFGKDYDRWKLWYEKRTGKTLPTAKKPDRASPPTSPDLSSSPPKGSTLRGGLNRSGFYDTKACAQFREIAWKVDVKSPVTSAPTVFGDTVFFGCEDGNVHALEASTGKERWVFSAKATSSAPSVAGETVYFGSDEGILYALDANSGAQRWKYKTKHGGAILCSPLVADGVVYFGNSGFYALDASTGALRWNLSFPYFSPSSPAIADHVLFFGTGENCFYAVDSRTRKIRWTFKTGDMINATPAVVNGVVYFACDDKCVYALHAATGKLKWKYAAKFPVWASPAVHDGLVVVALWEGNIVAFDAGSGEKKWEYFFGSMTATYASPCIAGGLVFHGNAYGNYAALDLQSGKERWKTRIGGFRLNEGSVISDSVIFAGCKDGIIYALR